MREEKVKKRHRGFTLMELLVAMAIMGIVTAGIYSAYYSQQKSYMAQNQVVAMQQNLRAALLYMEREIRMAGYDPTKLEVGRIITAGANTLQMSMDLNGDGDVADAGENITYAFYNADGDGDNDLGRNIGAGNVLLAENIDALNFVYLDVNGNVTAVINDIRSIQISLVARADRIDPGFQNNVSYSNRQGTVIYVAPGDGFRRRLAISQVKCRNIGLP